MGGFVISIGRNTINSVEYVIGLLGLLISVLKAFFATFLASSSRLIKEITNKQIIFTAIDTIPIITIISLGLGGIVIIQTFTQLSKFGAVDFSGKILDIVFVRELSALFTALLIISRSGTAITTEIGNMRVSKEIDSLEMMGIDVIQFLVLPRTIAVMVAVICLTVYFNVVAMLGGYLVTLVLGMHIKFSLFFKNVLEFLTIKDIVICTIKSFAFSVIIPIVGCYNGLSVKKSPTEVPAQTSRTVMNAIILCVLTDGVITVFRYL
jgi:phospholipid/cholesterol/gamma-HCH transport system permease protein